MTSERMEHYIEKEVESIPDEDLRGRVFDNIQNKVDQIQSFADEKNGMMILQFVMQDIKCSWGMTKM